jgi:thioredoxin reductase (NADPH)
MSSAPAENVIIVGTGCAGLTAAVYTARAGLAPLVLEGNQPGGQLTTTSEVENFPGFEHGIDGFMLTDTIRKQAARFGARYESALVESVDFSGPVKVLRTSNGELRARAVIISTGASPRMLGVAGEWDFFGGKGVTTCATCDGAFYRNLPVIVVGGGDSACEEALFLTRFASKVTVVHRRDQFRASRIMQQRVLEHPKISVVWNSAVSAIQGGDDGKVSGVTLRDTLSGAETPLETRGIFVAIGHLPNTKPFTPALAVDGNGYFVAEAGSQVRTRVPGVYVAGDCVDHVYRQAITAAGMGCQAAIEAERWLAGHG